MDHMKPEMAAILLRSQSVKNLWNNSKGKQNEVRNSLDMIYTHMYMCIYV